MRHRAALTLAAAVLVVAGCSADADPPAASTTASQPTAATESVPATGQADMQTTGTTPEPVPVTFEMDRPEPGATTASGRPLPSPSVPAIKVEVVRTADERVVERLTIDAGGRVEASLAPGAYLVRAAAGQDTPSRPTPFTVVAGEQDTVVTLPSPAWGIDPPPID